MIKLIMAFNILYSSISIAKCIGNRAALDIGSGNTKFKVATVDFCKGVILQVLYQSSSPIPYSDEINKNNMMLSRQVMEKGYQTVQGLVNKGRSFEVKNMQGVATAAFRKAKNGTAFIAMISRRLNIPIEIIDQEKEAKLGYYAALSRDKSAMTIWDIGGGSMQFVKKQRDKFDILGCRCGAVEFKNFYLTQIGQSTDKSPNPIGRKNISNLRKLARRFIIQSKIGPISPAAWSTSKAVGIGGVLSKSLPARIGRAHYNSANVLAALEKGADLSDAQIGGDYSATDITNLALVYEAMIHLGIESVKTLKVDLTEALLTKSISEI